MFFPLMVQMEGKQVVVVGGGLVALRKCMLFLDFGAEVSAVAPEFVPEFQQVAAVRRICASFHPQDLEGADLVVAATDSREINSAVSLCCRQRNIPVNVVDDPELCSFIVPATVRRGDLTLAVCTGGKSPATAGLIRRQLEQIYGPEMARRLELLGQIRELILQSEMPQQEKRNNLIHAARLDLSRLQVLKEALEENQTKKGKGSAQM